jgi:putative holliday junction resolvase
MPTIPNPTSSILALDVGDKRVGIATASAAARLPKPLKTLERGPGFFDELRNIIDAEAIGIIVVGLPRGLDGQTTRQTAATETFLAELRQQINLPVETQDEALTSRQAEAELLAGGKQYRRADIDALAAAYILEDFLADLNRLIEPSERSAKQ